MISRCCSILFFLLLLVSTAGAQSLQKLFPVPFSQVSVRDAFWSPRIQTVADATLKACIEYTENKTGRIRNFERAATPVAGKHEGIYYDDSDVYKALEAMAYSLRHHPNKELEAKADQWIDKIAAAQLPDGYLNTYYTLTGLDKRWTDMEKHEDYCAGHLIEAAIAYHNTTGKGKLLEVATRFADHIDSAFRLKDRPWVSGHQEIELALMKLYHHTGREKYLQLARWFLEQRGRGHGRGVIWDQWKDPKYCQDDVPVKEQKEITDSAWHSHTRGAKFPSIYSASVAHHKRVTSLSEAALKGRFRCAPDAGANGGRSPQEGKKSVFDGNNQSSSFFVASIDRNRKSPIFETRKTVCLTTAGSSMRRWPFTAPGYAGS